MIIDRGTQPKKKKLLQYIGVIIAGCTVVTGLLFLIISALGGYPFSSGQTLLQRSFPCDAGAWGEPKKITANTLPVKQKWQAEISEPIIYAPTILDGLVIVKTSESSCPLSTDSKVHIHALDFATGRELWKSSYVGLLDDIPPILFQDLVIFPINAEESLRSVNRNTGSNVWDIGFKNLMGSVKALASDDRRLFVVSGIDPPKISAFDPLTGKSLWEQQGPFPAKRFRTIRVYDGELFAFFSTSIYVLGRETGEILRKDSTDFMSYNTPTAIDNMLFRNDNESIVAFELNSMQDSWRFAPTCHQKPYLNPWPSHSMFLFAPNSYGDSVFVTGGCGTIFALRRDRGSVIWSYDTGEAESISPLVKLGDAGYVKFTDGSIRAIGLADGAILGRLDTDSHAVVWSSSDKGLAVFKDTLYFSLGDQRLYAFDK